MLDAWCASIPGLERDSEDNWRAAATGRMSHPDDGLAVLADLEAQSYWFNHRRVLEPIGNIPPAEANENYYAMLEKGLWPHNLNQSASGKPGAVQSDNMGYPYHFLGALPHGRSRLRAKASSGYAPFRSVPVS